MECFIFHITKSLRFVLLYSNRSFSSFFFHFRIPMKPHTLKEQWLYKFHNILAIIIATELLAFLGYLHYQSSRVWLNLQQLILLTGIFTVHENTKLIIFHHAIVYNWCIIKVVWIDFRTILCLINCLGFALDSHLNIE